MLRTTISDRAGWNAMASGSLHIAVDKREYCVGIWTLKYGTLRKWSKEPMDHCPAKLWLLRAVPVALAKNLLEDLWSTAQKLVLLTSVSRLDGL